MICERARDLLPQLLDPRADPATRDEVREHVAACAECRHELATLTRTAEVLDALSLPVPSTRLRQSFREMLENEKRSITTQSQPGSPPVESGPSSVWRWILAPLAACALLVLGFLAGQRWQTDPTIPAYANSQDEGTRQELIALREQINEQRQQLDKMTTLVGYSILQQQQNPANERLRDVLAAARAEDASDKVLDDLIQALTLDPSANVRLRALEALSPHVGRPTVRAGVLAALPREQNPLVQLELIDFVATAQDPDAAPLLQRIFSDESANQTVREAAKLALAQF